MDNDASPLKALLLQSKLCVQVDAYMDSDMSEVPYAIVFKGCDPNEVDQLETIFRSSLNQIVQNGIPLETIQAALHQLEFARSEIAADHAPFGLTLFMRSALAKQHGASAEQALMIHSLFEELLLKVQNPRYLPDLIQKYFIDNPHQVRLVLCPDPELCSKELQQEQEMLTQVKAKLSPQEIENILKETEELVVFQKQTEEQSIDCLPKVTLQDVLPTARSFILEESSDKNLTIYHHPCFTNHITYADLLFDLPHVDQEELGYLHLLISLIPELGWDIVITLTLKTR